MSNVNVNSNKKLTKEERDIMKAQMKEQKRMEKEAKKAEKARIKEQKRQEKEARKIAKQAEKLMKQDAKAKAKVQKELNKKLSYDVVNNSEKDIKIIEKMITKYEVIKEVKSVVTKEVNRPLIYKETLELLNSTLKSFKDSINAINKSYNEFKSFILNK